MGYGNGVVDWGAGANNYGDAGAVMAANRTINKYQKALKDTKKVFNRELARRIALRDTNRIWKKAGLITSEHQNEATRRMEQYENFMKKYGPTAFRERVIKQDQIDKTEPIL